LLALGVEVQSTHTCVHGVRDTVYGYLGSVAWHPPALPSETLALAHATRSGMPRSCVSAGCVVVVAG
jgi:hypothetical protein